MRVVFSAEAKTGLREIALFIARDNRTRASTFVEELRAKALAIAETPHAFPVVARYGKQGVRRRVFRDYLIFYTIGADAIRVVAIVHGAKNLDSLLNES